MAKYRTISLLLVLLAGVLYLVLYYGYQTQEKIKSSPTAFENKDEGEIKYRVGSDNNKNIQPEIKDRNISEKILTDLISYEIDSDIKFFLNKILQGELHNITQEEIRWVLSALQNDGKNHKQLYKAILDVYKSEISDDSRVFLVISLGEIRTFESVSALTEILDLDERENPFVIYENKRTIDNLADKNMQGESNADISSALIEYWKSSTNNLYKESVATAILKIGKIKESKIIIDKLDDSMDDDEINYIRDAMKEIRSSELTSLLIDIYNNDESSDTLKDASLSALPYIATEMAIVALFERAYKETNSDDLKTMKEYFEIIKQRNHDAEAIIKEDLFYNKTEFSSDIFKLEIEKIFKDKVK